MGKTTVLKLVDYCLGADGKYIYQGSELSEQSNTTVKDFLQEQEVLITVLLLEDLEDENSKRITIERNFLPKPKKVQRINGEAMSKADLDKRLKALIFETQVDKPTFQQIISKNIRVGQDKADHVVRTLGNYGHNEAYEALYLFWLGIDTTDSKQKQALTEAKRVENRFRKRLEEKGNLGKLPVIEQELAFHDGEIRELNQRKADFNLNKDYEKEVERLNEVRRNLNHVSTEISRLSMRRDLIMESKNELEQAYANIDAAQIRDLYKRAKALIPRVQASFEDTLKFHNELITQKLAHITEALPGLEQALKAQQIELQRLRKSEFDMTEKLRKTGVAEDLEEIITKLNQHFEQKGNLEEQRRLWEVSNEKIEKIEGDLADINKKIASKEDLIKKRITRFNHYFSKLSGELYGESYILGEGKKGANYELVVDAIENPGTGKKKGQIAAFDFAYIQFADELGIKCLHFIMHDQLESMHDNQLNTLVEIAHGLHGQYIVPILRDKIPSDIDVDQFEVLSLSQGEKLFKVP